MNKYWISTQDPLYKNGVIEIIKENVIDVMLSNKNSHRWTVSKLNLEHFFIPLTEKEAIKLKLHE